MYDPTWLPGWDPMGSNKKWKFCFSFLKPAWPYGMTIVAFPGRPGAGCTIVYYDRK